MELFTVYPGQSMTDPVTYFRFVSHAIGHANWPHLVGNFTLILLIGPILEEKYGSQDIFIMMLVTALITGVLQFFFFQTGLLGASGIVFMLIILSSFSNYQAGTIPLTFIIIAILFMGQEIVSALGAEDGVSQFAHIMGGICGGLFGFSLEKRKAK